MSRPNVGLVAWVLFGLAVAGLLTYGFVASRGPSLRPLVAGAAIQGTPGSIRTYGSILELLQGDVGDKVSLSAVPAGAGVVAVGSLGGLRGEIAILRGERWLARADGDRIAVERGADTNETAAFLALADVPRWQEQRFDAPVPFERLAAELEQRGTQAGLDTSRPFPLVIEGALTTIELEIANGVAPGTEPLEKRQGDAALKVSLPRAEGSVVGFFAASGGERLVHPGQRVHLHVVLPALRQMGHLRSAQIDAGARLRLPATR